MPNINVATNQEYIVAYNQYLQDHNLPQARMEYNALTGQDIPRDLDMFFSFLVDAVAMQIVRSSQFSDKLAFLYKDEIPYGRVIYDIRPICPNEDSDYGVVDFEVDVTNPYEKQKSKLSMVEHKANNYKKIKITYSYDQIRSAFNTAFGVSDLVQAIINQVYLQKNAWSYTAKRNSLAQRGYALWKKFTSFEDFTIKFQQFKSDMEYPQLSQGYNRNVIVNPSAESDLRIFISKDFKIEDNVKYLSSLFNVGYADIAKMVVEVDGFGDYAKDVVCVILDINGLEFRKILNDSDELRNPADKTRNYWLHFWEMISVSPNCNAVALVKTDNVDENIVLNFGGKKYLDDVNIFTDNTYDISITNNYTTEGDTITYKLNSNAAVSVDVEETLTVPYASLNEGVNTLTIYDRDGSIFSVNSIRKPFAK